MKIHFFTRGGKEIASSRVRVIQIIPLLEKLGIETKLHLPPKIFSKISFFRKIKLIWYFFKKISEIRSEDTLYLQKGGIYNKYFFINLLIYKLFKNPKIILDFDDAIFLSSSLRIFLYIKISDEIIVGSHYLQDYAKKHHKKVWLIPSSIPYQIYSKFTIDYHKKNSPIVLGWIGHGIAHYENLKILPPIFITLIKKKIPFKFILIGAKKDPRIHQLFEIDGLDKEIIDEIKWKATNIPLLIQKFDIGLYPLCPTPFNQGRCAYKVIEYMGCGVPVIGSKVGENNYLIEDGKNGFLVGTRKDWILRIKELVFDDELRKKIGQAGQKTVKENYSYQVNILKLFQIFRQNSI